MISREIQNGNLVPLLDKFLKKEHHDKLIWEKGEIVVSEILGDTTSPPGERGKDTVKLNMEVRVRAESRTQISCFSGEEGFGYPRIVMAGDEYRSKKRIYDFVAVLGWEKFNDKDFTMIFPEHLVDNYTAILQDSRGNWWYRDGKIPWEGALPANRFLLPDFSLKENSSRRLLLKKSAIRGRLEWLKKLK